MQLVTAGARGASLHGEGMALEAPVWPITAIDTTGAGDVFLGYLVSAFARGADTADALREAAAAAALQVTRPGTADAIPTRAEVRAWLDGMQASG